MKIRIHLILLLLSIFLIFSCKSTASPVVFDNSYEYLKNEIEIITLMINENHLQKARERLEKNLLLHKNSHELLTLEIYLLYKEGDKTLALNKGERLLLSNRNNPLLYSLLARIYFETDELTKAENYIKLSLNIARNLPYTWYQKGLIEYQQEKYTASELSFNRAYMLDRTHTDAYFFRYLSRLRNKAGIDEVKHQWSNFKKIGNPKAFHFLFHAETLYKLNLFEDTLTILNEGMELFPNDPYLLNFSAYTDVKRFEKSDDLEILNEGLKKIEKALSYITIAEFADTHLQILFLLNNKEVYERNLNRYKLLFPQSQDILDRVKNHFPE